MQKFFHQNAFSACYNDREEGWYLYKNNLKVGLINDCLGKVSFVDRDTPFSPNDLTDISTLIQAVNNQYELLLNV
jgi:hypothetical protein